MFKGLGNIANLMKQAQEMGGKMQQINEELKDQTRGRQCRRWTGGSGSQRAG